MSYVSTAYNKQDAKVGVRIGNWVEEQALLESTGRSRIKPWEKVDSTSRCITHDFPGGDSKSWNGESLATYGRFKTDELTQTKAMLAATKNRELLERAFRCVGVRARLTVCDSCAKVKCRCAFGVAAGCGLFRLCFFVLLLVIVTTLS